MCQEKSGNPGEKQSSSRQFRYFSFVPKIVSFQIAPQQLANPTIVCYNASAVKKLQRNV
jgi:hypothetical protein